MVLIPLGDRNPLKRVTFAFGNVALIAICVLTFFWQQSLGNAGHAMIYAFGAIPSVITGERVLPPQLAVIPAELTLVTSMFLHGSWMHLIGNMLFLWVFGDNIEDAMGHLRYPVFYVVCGIGATLVQVALSLESQVPTIGASGAVSGILGAYLILHPRAKVLIFALRVLLPIPAFVVLGAWIGFQVFSAYLNAGSEDGGGVAWWAHIGGFVIGAVLIVPFRRRGVPLFDRGAGLTADENAPQARARLVRGRSVVPQTRRRD
jgi:membrane associated rhomboid family serine protease